MSKILVTGATGEYGKATIDFLLKKGTNPSDITALVRDENKATELKSKGVKIVKGDYENYDSLINAFKGVEKLLFISANDFKKRVEQQTNVVNAAKEAQVKHVIYTSLDRKSEDGSSPIAFIEKAHVITEKLIKESGLPYTILLNNLYLEFFPLFIGDKVLETGTIYFPAEDGRAGIATRTDMAEATANILLSEGHQGKIYQFSNNVTYSFTDAAKAISEVTGKEIKYVSPNTEEYIKVLTDAGVPQDFAGLFASFARAQAIGELDFISNDLEKLLGRKPTSLIEYFTVHYGKK